MSIYKLKYVPSGMAMWPNGKALDYDSFEIEASRDSRFDPWHGQFFLFGNVAVD